MDYKIIGFPRTGNYVVREDVEPFGGRFLVVNKLSGNVYVDPNEIEDATVFKSYDKAIEAIQNLLAGPERTEEIYRTARGGPVKVTYKGEITDGKEPKAPNKGDAYSIINRLNALRELIVYNGSEWVDIDPENIPEYIV